MADLTNHTEENTMNTAEVNDYARENQIAAEVQTEETIGSDLPDKMENYKVIGELVIGKIG